MHINKVNGKIYIGITSQTPNRRWGYNGNRYKNSALKNAIKKYGWDNFLHEVVFDGLEEQDAKYLEQLLIKCFNSKSPYGYNLTDGGDGTSGFHVPNEIREKISETLKNKWNDPLFRDEMTKIKNLPNSPYKSKAFKEKISCLVAGENNPNYNHKWSDDKKKKLSLKQKNNPMYKNETNPNAKRIRCIETGEIFNCMKYAQEKFGLKSTGSFTAAIKNGKTAAGYHWEYI